MELLTIIASTTAEHSTESAGLFQALGIDIKLLIEQALAFLILVFILGKFVYPPLMRAVDGRRDAIEAGLKEAKESQEAAEKAQAVVADTLTQARKDADDILARTQSEAVSLISDAEEKAKQRAEQIIADARAQLNVDIANARDALKKDAVEMVYLATEKIIGHKLDAGKDADLVKNALSQEKA